MHCSRSLNSFKVLIAHIFIDIAPFLPSSCYTLHCIEIPPNLHSELYYFCICASTSFEFSKLVLSLRKSVIKQVSRFAYQRGVSALRTVRDGRDIPSLQLQDLFSLRGVLRPWGCKMR